MRILKRLLDFIASRMLHHHGGMRAADYFVLSGDEHGEYLGAD